MQRAQEKAMKKLFIKGIEFFSFLTAIGLKGLLTPFDDNSYPTLSVSHPSPGKIKITTENGDSVTMSDTDTLVIDLDGSMSVKNGPSHYSNRWQKLFSTTSLKKSALKKSKDPVFVPYGCMAMVYDSNRSVNEREAVVYHQPGTMIYGYELVILFNKKDQPAEFFVRAEKSDNAFARFKKFLIEHELEQCESGAFNHVRVDAQARFEARVAADKAKSARNHEKWNLMSKLDISVPVIVEVGGKKLTVRNGTIYRGAKLGGSRLNLDAAFDNGVLHLVAAQVTARLEANTQTNAM